MHHKLPTPILVAMLLGVLAVMAPVGVRVGYGAVMRLTHGPGPRPGQSCDRALLGKMDRGGDGLVRCVLKSPLADPEWASVAPVRVAMYGDSLAFEARAPFETAITRRHRAEVHVNAGVGTALCDWRADIDLELTEWQPDVLVVQFSGNAFTPCMEDERGERLVGAAIPERYRADVRSLVDRIAETKVQLYLIGSPVSRSMADAGQAENWLNPIYREIADQREQVHFFDAGQAVLAEGRYTPTLPCVHDEPCAGDPETGAPGLNPVRSPDGTHFCPEQPMSDAAYFLRCPVWSSGAWRFGEAMAKPIISDLDL